MPEQTYVVGDPAMQPQPMLTTNGPGWRIDVCDPDDPDEIARSFMLWAPRTAEEARQRGVLGPNPARDYWAAGWEMNGGRDGNLERADSPSVALASFRTCPRREEALNAAMALFTAAEQHQSTAALTEQLTDTKAQRLAAELAGAGFERTGSRMVEHREAGVMVAVGPDGYRISYLCPGTGRQFGMGVIDLEPSTSPAEVGHVARALHLAELSAGQAELPAQAEAAGEPPRCGCGDRHWSCPAGGSDTVSTVA